MGLLVEDLGVGSYSLGLGTSQPLGFRFGALFLVADILSRDLLVHSKACRKSLECALLKACPHMFFWSLRLIYARTTVGDDRTTDFHLLLARMTARERVPCVYIHADKYMHTKTHGACGLSASLGKSTADCFLRLEPKKSLHRDLSQKNEN